MISRDESASVATHPSPRPTMARGAPLRHSNITATSFSSPPAPNLKHAQRAVIMGSASGRRRLQLLRSWPHVSRRTAIGACVCICTGGSGCWYVRRYIYGWACLCCVVVVAWVWLCPARSATCLSGLFLVTRSHFAASHTHQRLSPAAAGMGPAGIASYRYMISLQHMHALSQYLRDTIVSSAHVRADFVTEDSDCTSSAALYCGTASKSSHQPRTAVHQAPVHGMGGSGPRAFACASRLKRRAHGYKYLQTSCYRRVSSFEN